MKALKTIFAILSLVAIPIIWLQSCSVSVVNAIEENGHEDGMAGGALGFVFIFAGIVGLVTRSSKIGNFITSLIYFVGWAIVKSSGVGYYEDLEVWSYFSLVCAIIFFIGCIVPLKIFNKKNEAQNVVYSTTNFLNQAQEKPEIHTTEVEEKVNISSRSNTTIETESSNIKSFLHKCLKWLKILLGVLGVIFVVIIGCAIYSTTKDKATPTSKDNNFYNPDDKAYDKSSDAYKTMFWYGDTIEDIALKEKYFNGQLPGRILSRFCERITSCEAQASNCRGVYYAHHGDTDPYYISSLNKISKQAQEAMSIELCGKRVCKSEDEIVKYLKLKEKEYGKCIECYLCDRAGCSIGDFRFPDFYFPNGIGDVLKQIIRG